MTVPRLDRIAPTPLPIRNRWRRIAAGTFVFGAACAVTWRVARRASDPERATICVAHPTSNATMAETGDRALAWPHPLDTSTEAVPGELPLRAFSCSKAIGGKRENGRLEVSFSPTSPQDVSFRVAFHGASPECNYAGELRLVKGRLDDGFLGNAYEYRCRRSPEHALAVRCGPYLGSELHVVMRGNGTGRTVAFQVPPSFQAGLKDARTCDLPFVAYDSDGGPIRIDSGELVFDLADCRASGG